MAFKPVLTVPVPYRGGVFYFGAADEALARFGAAVDRAAGTEEITLALCRLFVAGVRNWQGVVDETDQPLPCTIEMREGFLTADKTGIAEAYLDALEELAGKKAPRPEPPTCSTPPAATAGPRPTSERNDDAASRPAKPGL